MNDIRIIRAHERDASTAQTPGMTRLAGVAPSTCGATGVWMGKVSSDPGFRTGAHHHGAVESAIYMIAGHMTVRWGDRLQHEAEAAAGDFVFIPAQLVHQEVNLSDTEPLVAIVARGGDNIVVNVELTDARA